MDYLLLTGATGLLGSYLLRRGLRAGRRMAVLVRPSQRESARQRIESILARREQEDGIRLPRPVVLEGDLHQANLGLDAADIRWIARHCTSLLHSAASLTFFGSDPKREPWLSNVTGTRRILSLCRCTNIRRLHYVSTAYVCGLRSGRVLESELDVGQQMGNDYEQSKMAAEKLVRSAAFLDSVTIFRPAIIVGDARSGYTTTFHGFYVVLKVAHMLVSRLVLGATAAQMVLEALGLSGKERKNFVPVDWVAAAMWHIVARPEHHGRTYHLAAKRPMTLRRMAQVVQEAVERYSVLADESDAWRCDRDWFARNLFEQIGIYRSYLRDDPGFDTTNTAAAAPHLPCDQLDNATLLRMAKFAIDSNFGKVRQRPIKPSFDAQQHLRGILRSAERDASQHGSSACVGLQVNGPGGGQWRLLFRDGQIVALEDGLSPQCAATVYLSSNTFERLVERQLSVSRAFEMGRLAIQGGGLPPWQLEAILHVPAFRRAAA